MNDRQLRIILYAALIVSCLITITTGSLWALLSGIVTVASIEVYRHRTR